MADVQGVSQPPASCHPWASLDERRVSLQERARDAWERHFGVSQRSTGHRSIGKLLQDLKSAECPAPTTSVPLRQVRGPRSTPPPPPPPSGQQARRLTLSHFGPQVQLYSSLHLTRAVLSWLLDDGGQLMTELWKAAAWFRDADHFSTSAEICRLLFPDGAPRTFKISETGIKPQRL